MNLKEIRDAALKLPRKSRILLAQELMNSARTAWEREVDDAWAEEVERRIDDLNSGKSKSRPLSEFLRELPARRPNHR
jgi:putative addiction module component (TIGR02574 family)